MPGMHSRSEVVTPELLASLGRQAAHSFLTSQVGLNESITKLAQGVPGLTDNHVQRIVENANTDVYTHLFKTQEDKNITFDLADTPGVIQKLATVGMPTEPNSDARPTVEEPVLDYHHPPTPYKEKMAHARIPWSEATPPNAATFIPQDNPTRDLEVLYFQAQKGVGVCREKIASVEADLDLFSKQLLAEVGTAHASGVTLGEITSIFDHVSGGNEKVASALSMMALDHLSKSEPLEQLRQELDVVRGSVPDPDYPLMKCAHALIGISRTEAKVRQEIEPHLRQLSDIEGAFRELRRV